MHPASEPAMFLNNITATTTTLAATTTLPTLLDFSIPYNSTTNIPSSSSSFQHTLPTFYNDVESSTTSTTAAFAYATLFSSPSSSAPQTTTPTHRPPPPTVAAPTSDTFAADAAIAAMIDSAPEAGQPLDRCHPYNDAFNCTAAEYLLFSFGPPTQPWPFLITITILYGSIFVAGVVGNVLVCWVIARHPAMRTATNYYLFSLALSDLLYLCAGLPFDLSLFWWEYPFVLGIGVCKLRALISEAATYVSVLTITAFSMERYLAICHPLYVYTMGGFGRAMRIIAGLWIVSFASAVPFGVYTTISYLYYPPDDFRVEARIAESAFCAMLDDPPGIPLWELSSLCFFVLPMCVMLVLYGRMGLAIRKRSERVLMLGVQETGGGGGGGGGSVRSNGGGGGARSVQSRKAIIRMLATVCLTFFVSWAPFHAQRLMFLYARDWEDYELMNMWLFSVAGLFYYVQCTVNPVLYNVMSHRYRRAFKETLFGGGEMQRGRRRSSGRSYR